MTTLSMIFVWLRFLLHIYDNVFYNILMTTFSITFLWLHAVKHTSCAKYMLHRVTNICYFQGSIQFVLLLLRPEPLEPMKAETTPYLCLRVLCSFLWLRFLWYFYDHVFYVIFIIICFAILYTNRILDNHMKTSSIYLISSFSYDIGQINWICC
jgi:hypothetical protein